MADKRVAIDVTTRAGGAVRGFKQVEDAAQRTATKTHGHFAGASSKIGGLFGKIGSQVGAAFGGIPIAGAALGTLTAGVGALAGESIHMADSFESAHLRLETAIKNSGGNFDKFKGQIDHVTNAASNLGFNMIDVQNALGTMTTGTGSAQKAIQSLGLAEDIARFSHHSLGDASLALTKAMEGQLRPLKALGIDVPVAAGGALKLQKAYLGVVGATNGVTAVQAKIHAGLLTGHAATAALAAANDKLKVAQTKLSGVQAASGVIVKALGVVHGQAAAYVQGLGGKQDVLKTKMENLQITIGQKLTPVIVALESWVVTKMIPTIEKWSAWIQKNWADIKKWGTVLVMVTNPIFLVGIALVKLWNRFSEFRNVVMRVLGSVKTYIKGVFDYLVGLFNFFNDLIHGRWSKLWGDVLQIVTGVWEQIKGLVGLAVTAVATTLRAAWSLISDEVTAGWNGIFDWFSKLPGRLASFISGIPGAMRDFGANIIRAIVDGIMSMGGAVSGAIHGLLSHIPGAGLLKHVPGASLLGFADGGRVPGPIGAPMLAVVHGGETVIPTNGRGMGGVVHVTISAGAIVANKAELGRYLQDALRAANGQRGHDHTYGQRVAFT